MKVLLRWVVALLAASEAGWMAVDGARALVTGDYFTPSSGEYAGRLGPWAALVEGVGIDPRATGVKIAFVAYGVVWLGVIGAFLARRRRSHAAMAALAAGSLWYLVVGTVTSALVLALLLLPALRRSSREAA